MKMDEMNLLGNMMANIIQSKSDFEIEFKDAEMKDIDPYTLDKGIVRDYFIQFKEHPEWFEEKEGEHHFAWHGTSTVYHLTGDIWASIRRGGFSLCGYLIYPETMFKDFDRIWKVVSEVGKNFSCDITYGPEPDVPFDPHCWDKNSEPTHVTVIGWDYGHWDSKEDVSKEDVLQDAIDLCNGMLKEFEQE